MMRLLDLAPEIQQRVLALPETTRRQAISERALRPIAHLKNAADQKVRFQELLDWGEKVAS